MEYTFAELHMHTAETSACGKVPAAEAVRIFKDNGYDLVCITDHFNERYFKYYETLLPAGLSPDEKWRASVEMWFAGWYAAREAGEKYGVPVLHGAEIQLNGRMCEFLVYGLPDEAYFEHPYLYELPVEEFSRIARSYGAFITMAHPFRRDDRLDTSLYDGAEIFNASESFHDDGGRDDTHNDNARKFARDAGLIPTCGQDYHELHQMRGIKTRFRGRVGDMPALIAKLRGREFDMILPDGEILPADDKYFDRKETGRET